MRRDLCSFSYCFLKHVYIHKCTERWPKGVLVLPNFCKIVVARQVFGRMCSIVFFAYTLKLPIQTLLSVAPTKLFF